MAVLGLFWGVFFGFVLHILSPKICLIFVGRGVNFEFLRGLHHVGLFWEMA
jgi:hypothetical protein